MDLYSVCLKLLHQMSRNITALPEFTTEDTLASTLMIWVLDVVRFVMHQMLPTDLLDGVLVLVSVICHSRGAGESRKRWFRSFDWDRSKRDGRYQMIHRT
jgi:hypothetical protein